MAFTKEMIALSDQELIIRTSSFMALQDEGYVDDIVIEFSMKENMVEPLTWEGEFSFHYEFWGALRYFLSQEPEQGGLEEDSFQIELADGSAVLYSEYDGPTTEPWDRENVRAVFKECVWQITTS